MFAATIFLISIEPLHPSITFLEAPIARRLALVLSEAQPPSCGWSLKYPRSRSRSQLYHSRVRLVGIHQSSAACKALPQAQVSRSALGRNSCQDSLPHSLKFIY